MTGPSRAPGNPLRQLLVGVPLGLLLASTIFDLIAAGTGVSWWRASGEILLHAGVVGGIVAYPLTLIDVLAVRPDLALDRLRRMHELSHGLAVALFLASWLLRDTDPGAGSVALRLSVSGAALAVLSTAIGDRLAFRASGLRERRRGIRRPTRYIHHRL